MAYIKTTWNDRIVAKPMTFTLINNGDGTTTLQSAEGAITQAGTPLNSLNLNHLETQYDQAMTDIATQYLKLIGGTLTGALSIGSGAGVTPLTLTNDNGQILIVNDPTENSLQSLIANGTASRPFTIEGLNGANLTNFNVRADNSNFFGNIAVTKASQNVILKGTGAGNANNAYLEIQDSAGARAGFFGKTSSSSATMAVWSDIGDMVVRATTNVNLNIVGATVLSVSSTGISVTGTIASTSTVSINSASAGSTLAQFKNSVDDGYIRIVTTATNNFIQSGNNAFTASKNLQITGFNGASLPVLTLNADNTFLSGTLTINQGGTLSNLASNAFTHFTLKKATMKSWTLQHSASGDLVFYPSTVADGTTWDTAKAITFNATTGIVNATVGFAENGTNLTAKYAQLGANNTFTGANNVNNQFTVDRATAGVNLIIARNSVDDGNIRLITTAGQNYIQSGNYAGSSPKNFTINGWSSTVIPLFTVTATSSVFSGTIEGTTINATSGFTIAGTPLSNIYLDKTLSSLQTLTGNLTAPTINGSTTLQEMGLSLTQRYVRLDGSNTMTGTLNVPIVNATTKFQEAGIDLDNIYMPIAPSSMSLTDGTNPSRTFISTKVGDVNGFGVGIGAGGLVVVGGGESASAVLADSTYAGGTEHLILSADSNVRIFSNCNTYTNRHELNLDNNAKLTLDGDCIARTDRGTNLWTGSSVFVGATVISLGVNIADCPNGIMLEWRQISGTAFLHYEPIWKNNAQDSVSHMNAGYNSPATYCGKNYTLTGGGTSITGSDTNNTGVMANRVLTRIYIF